MWELIDWVLVGSSALWILGLSIIIAALSFADYYTTRTHDRFWATLQKPGYRVALHGGLHLVCLGLALNARPWWLTLIWLGMGVGFGHRAWQAWRERRRSG